MMRRLTNPFWRRIEDYVEERTRPIDLPSDEQLLGAWRHNQRELAENGFRICYSPAFLPVMLTGEKVISQADASTRQFYKHIDDRLQVWERQGVIERVTPKDADERVYFLLPDEERYYCITD